MHPESIYSWAAPSTTWLQGNGDGICLKRGFSLSTFCGPELGLFGADNLCLKQSFWCHPACWHCLSSLQKPCCCLSGGYGIGCRLNINSFRSSLLILMCNVTDNHGPKAARASQQHHVFCLWGPGEKRSLIIVESLTARVIWSGHLVHRAVQCHEWCHEWSTAWSHGWQAVS